MIPCRKCGKEFEDESLVHLHHITPKYAGGIDKDGRCYLCQKCHGILHKIIESILFKYHIPDHRKERAKQSIKSFTLGYIGDKKENDSKTNIR